MCDSPRTGCVLRTTLMWREQAEIRWARRGIFIVAWCHSVKLCALAAQPVWSQQTGALIRMWRWCQAHSQTDRAMGAVHCKNEGMLLQPLIWRCIECGFRMANRWKWTDMNMHLDLNLATFEYIDRFGCYHFCLNTFGLELWFPFELLQLLVQSWDCRLR